jgi:hypothetical protein
VRSFDFFGRSANVAVVVPYAWLSGSATFRGDQVEREVSGFGDPRLRIAVNLYGAPALSLEAFADYRQDLIIGVSVTWGCRSASTTATSSSTSGRTGGR